MSDYAVYFDAEGNQIDGPGPNMATGEVSVTDAEGNTIRQYVVGPAWGGPQPVDPDAFDKAVEGPEGPFDLTWTDDKGDTHPVETLVDLFAALGAPMIGGDRLRERVWNVMLLPSWKNAPEDLREAVNAYLSM
jgi:hypothetical protein